MGKLSDILSAGGQSGDGFTSAWNTTDAAGDYDPLPAGWYVCRAESGELDNSSKKGTPGYKLTFVVIEGDFLGRKLWHDLWLTSAALPMTKRDLAKLGIDDPAKLELPLPPGIRCKVQVKLRKDDDGAERNRVNRFDVICIDPPEPDAFAPSEPDDQPPAGDTAAPLPVEPPLAAKPASGGQQRLDLKGGGDVPF